MFKVGTTSYILPADILTNVEYLAARVDDVELVLFESREYGNNLPDATLCSRLRKLAALHDLSYTVHLPLDLRFSNGDGSTDLDLSLQRAQATVDATRDLAPYAYVAHLDGRPLTVREPSGPDLARWQADAQQALATVAAWLPDPVLLAVENLEAWEPEAFAPVIEALPVSRTIDVGHFWLAGADPLPHLERWLGRARVIHMHGINGRDHASLAHVPPEQLDPVIAVLVERFTGVVTLEIFSEADLVSSLAALRASLDRCGTADGEAFI